SSDLTFLLSVAVSVQGGNAMHIVINDHLGTPQLLIDDDQAIIWQADYEDFGAVTANGVVEQNIRFPGQYYDKETGLHYNYYRDYDPHLGRYLQPDPIGLLYDFSDPKMTVAMKFAVPLDSNKALSKLG